MLCCQRNILEAKYDFFSSNHLLFFFDFFDFFFSSVPRSMNDAHAREVADVLKHFNVQADQGLSPQQYETQLKKHGKNSLPEPDKTPLWKMILEQFEDNLVRILLGAAIISFVLALFEEGDERAQAFVEPLVILLILIANAIVGVYQESSAEEAIEVFD